MQSLQKNFITFANPRVNKTLQSFALLYAIMLEYCLAEGDRICSLKSVVGSQLNLSIDYGSIEYIF